jgi:Flp pilus assembly pilin Flp
MKKAIHTMKTVVLSEEGASGVEYALLLAMVAVAIIVGGAGLYTAVCGKFTSVTSAVSSPT